MMQLLPLASGPPPRGGGGGPLLDDPCAAPAAPASLSRCQVYADEPWRLLPLPAPAPDWLFPRARRAARRAVTRAAKTRRLDQRGAANRPPRRGQPPVEFDRGPLFPSGRPRPPPTTPPPQFPRCHLDKIGAAAAGPPPRPLRPPPPSLRHCPSTKPVDGVGPGPPPPPLTLTSVARGVCGGAAVPPTHLLPPRPAGKRPGARPAAGGRTRVPSASPRQGEIRLPRRWSPPTRGDVTGQWPRGGPPSGRSSPAPPPPSRCRQRTPCQGRRFNQRETAAGAAPRAPPEPAHHPPPAPFPPVDDSFFFFCTGHARAFKQERAHAGLAWGAEVIVVVVVGASSCPPPPQCPQNPCLVSPARPASWHVKGRYAAGRGGRRQRGSSGPSVIASVLALVRVLIFPPPAVSIA